MLKKMGPEVMPSPQVGGKFMSGLLRLTRAATTGVSMVSDEDISKISHEGFKNYLGHFPAGTSYMCSEHYRQILIERKFQKFDYGTEANM
mmetsp:Transcript_31291/g.41405  ORF Transcript_31291/g.41405 Transcript_31291/m.41405 type:complete len:90 (-) Transcript_31291:442-711(-)